MDPKQRYIPNDAQVAGKVLDGEAIIINLSNGVYYSLAKVGGVIWEEIMRGASVEEIVSAITADYTVSPEQAWRDFEILAAELWREDLILAANQERAPRATQAHLAAEKKNYEPPTLNIYRDMNDLLALDPPMPGLQDVPWKDADE